MITWVLRVLLIVLPIVAALYWINIKRRPKTEAGDIRRQELALLGITATVFVSVLLSLALLAPRNGGSPDDVYTAPYEKDGKIIPGEFLSPEEARARGLLDKAPEPAEDEPLETFGD
jgi:hypothetical protein